MSDLISFVHQQEVKRVREEVRGSNVSAIFDGTTRLGEAMAITLRFVDDQWGIQQRLVRFQLLSKSMTVARQLIPVLQMECQVPSNALVATMHDRASVNTVAMTILHVVFPGLLDIGCFSHTIDNAGNHFNTPTLNEFTSPWLTLFSHSPKARLLWRERTGVAMKSYSKTRWWSK